MHHIQSALLTTLLMKKIVKVFKEIIDFKNFDDVVMSGRESNKGSKNFSDYLKTSLNLSIYTIN